MAETDCRFNLKALCCCAQSKHQMKVCPVKDKKECKYYKPDTEKRINLEE
jgi:hypothetical protein